MTLETIPWNSAEFLETPEAITAYIEAAFEDGDPAVITHALGVVARANSMFQLARDADVTREALYKALTSDGDPKPSRFIRVLKALGMKLTAQAA
jgi:probable addiction module antidote protein